MDPGWHGIEKTQGESRRGTLLLGDRGQNEAGGEILDSGSGRGPWTLPSSVPQLLQFRWSPGTQHTLPFLSQLGIRAQQCLHTGPVLAPFSPSLSFVSAGISSRASHVLGKRSTTGWHPHHCPILQSTRAMGSYRPMCLGLCTECFMVL